MLVLTADSLFNTGKKYTELNDSIDSAAEWIIDHEVPICDYVPIENILHADKRNQV